jgi:hypothetical protein
MEALVFFAGLALLAGAQSRWHKPGARKGDPILLAVLGVAFLVTAVYSYAGYGSSEGLVPLALLAVAAACVAAGRTERARQGRHRHVGLALYLAGALLAVAGGAGLLAQ